MNKIADRLYRLGDVHHPCFLITGTAKTALVDAGPAFMAPIYRDEIRQFMGAGRGPDALFLTHFHYDHIGGAPYLRRCFPTMEIGGSKKLGRLLARGKIVSRIAQLNRGLLDDHPHANVFRPEDFDYAALKIDNALQHGDLIDLGGGVVIEAIDSPGHTPDNLSFYLPHAEAIVAAEALGIIPGDEFWVAPQFLSSYEKYLESIERIRQRRPKILLLGHHQVVQGKDVDRFFEAAVADCRKYRKMIERFLQRENMAEDRAVSRVYSQLVRTLRRGRQPEEAFRLNLEVQVKVVARRMRLR